MLCSQGEFKNVKLLCQAADVSRKCYYQYLKNKDKETENDRIIEFISQMQEKHSNGIGYRPMTYLAGKKFDKPVNRKRIRRLMKENDLQSGVRRKRYSDETYAKLKDLRNDKPKDLIERHFFSLAPRTRMLCDITYLPGKEKTWYLNSIEDLYNGEIVAWCISSSPNAKLCMDTVIKLVESGVDVKDVIIHNDLGSTYMSKAYRALLSDLGIRISVGRRGSCYDNAPMESLNGIIKTESLYCKFGKSRVENHKVSYTDLISEVTKFICYYNYDRPKEALCGMSPIEFRKQNPHGKYLVPVTQSKS